MVEPKKRCRRWLQFSLRSFLIAVAVFGICLGFHVRSVRKQQAAVEAILRNGGEVFYDFQAARPPASGYDAEGKSTLPAWVLSQLGVDFFHDVEWAHIVPTSDGSILQHLDAIPKLRDLILEVPPSDDDLRCVGRLDRLETLRFDASSITDEGLRHIGRLERLKTLVLWQAVNVTDAGVAQLVSLRNLECFFVDHVKGGDECLRLVASLPRIERIIIDDADVSDAGLAHLKGLKQLTHLSLGGSNITNAGLAHLAGLTSLEELHLLLGTSLTSDGLVHLKGLKNLRELWVNINTTADDASVLRKALPNCMIHFR